MRLDQALVARGLLPTRSRARDAILRGTVTVAGRVEIRPGHDVPDAAPIALDDPAARWVSRAALKLVAGLDGFGFSPAGRRCLDLGASTGGFTQVLLEYGAHHVISIDVGHDQLHPSLAGDARVTSIEGLNARELTAAHLGGPIGGVVADVSFISLALALPPALALAEPGAFGVFLVKPQFEVGRGHIGKGGVVRDAAAARQAVDAIADVVAGCGWRVIGVIDSPLAGGDGNREFVLGAVKTGKEQNTP